MDLDAFILCRFCINGCSFFGSKELFYCKKRDLFPLLVKKAEELRLKHLGVTLYKLFPQSRIRYLPALKVFRISRFW